MVIALLTDFGTTDVYVGVMKGVMLDICPAARLVDLTHAVQPQNIRQGAFVLLNAYHYFPAGTVFLAVVDPGVGSARRPVAVRAGAYTFVAPDNGLLSYVLADTPPDHVVELNNPVYRLTSVSYTFHGRDIFAPAAAHLAAGVSLNAMGTPLEQIVSLPVPLLNVEPDVVRGEVLHLDHFGNAVTSIGLLEWLSAERLRLKPRFGGQATAREIVTGHAEVRLNGQTICGVVPTYSHTHPGDLLAMVGSSGHLEIAVNQGSAAARLGTRIGDAVELRMG